jgi:hypothetical protein
MEQADMTGGVDGLATCVLLFGVHALGGGGRRSGAPIHRSGLKPRQGTFSSFNDGRQHGPCALAVPGLIYLGLGGSERRAS